MSLINLPHNICAHARISTLFQIALHHATAAGHPPESKVHAPERAERPDDVELPWSIAILSDRALLDQALRERFVWPASPWDMDVPSAPWRRVQFRYASTSTELAAVIATDVAAMTSESGGPPPRLACVVVDNILTLLAAADGRPSAQAAPILATLVSLSSALDFCLYLGSPDTSDSRVGPGFFEVAESYVQSISLVRGADIGPKLATSDRFLGIATP
ncbi:hypothetical protein GGF31_000832 [Allomyces arbusculus]|nr:hypothetical protein GGF31_000832 [Allomyces arbusculus]